jgi:hypothetical protein
MTTKSPKTERKAVKGSGKVDEDDSKDDSLLETAAAANERASIWNGQFPNMLLIALTATSIPAYVSHVFTGLDFVQNIALYGVTIFVSAVMLAQAYNKVLTTSPAEKEDPTDLKPVSKKIIARLCVTANQPQSAARLRTIKMVSTQIFLFNSFFLVGTLFLQQYLLRHLFLQWGESDWTNGFVYFSSSAIAAVLIFMFGQLEADNKSNKKKKQ